MNDQRAAVWLDPPPSVVESSKLARVAAEQLFRPISRKYDKAEHEAPIELEVMRNVGGGGSGRSSVRSLRMLLMIEQLCWGDVGLMLARPGQGLGNAAIGAVGTPEQKEQWGRRFASMAITEPHAGSDSKMISTRAVRDGDSWVLNGEKIFVTDGDRCDCAVVWATVDPEAGKAGIRSFFVEKGTPGFAVTRLERKLGIKASDTATFAFTDCRIPADNLLGGEPKPRSGDGKRSTGAFGGAMQTFDNTRPIVSAMAVGVGAAAVDLVRELLVKAKIDLSCDRPEHELSALARDVDEMEAKVQAARLLTLKAGWQMDQKMPNSLAASMAKAYAGRTCTEVALQCCEIAGAAGYGEEELLEKIARDVKILDIFEGTQQIQQLIIARTLFGLSSRELR